jgi:tetratricopeptide (TPR) repeat protein
VGGASLRKRVAVLPDGAVYRGFHRELRTDVRVELFPSAFVERNLGFIGRLLAGAARTEQLRSVHVVTLLDLGRRQDCCYIVTEWLPSSLRSLIVEGPLSPNRVLALVEQLLRGLCAVHSLGAAHGCVTPEGVLLDYDGSAKLPHLGTAVRPQELNRLVLTSEGSIGGPALYLAPERVRDERRADIRSDLYSLGATMFQMLAGRPPYLGASAQEVMLKHAEEPTPDLRGARPDAPADIAAFVRRLMAKDPAERPQTPQAALDELRERAVELSRRGEIAPVRAAASRRDRLRDTVKWAALWGTLAAVLVALAVFPGALMCRQRRQQQAAEALARLPRSRRVLIAVAEAESALRDPLSAERAAAVHTLIAHALAFHPEVEVVDPLRADELARAGLTPEQVRESAEVAYSLVAAHAPGLERRLWTLSLAGGGQEGWSVQVRCAVEEDGPDGLGALEGAVHKLLARAAEPLGAEPPAQTPPSTGADAAAWHHAAEAMAAERNADWDQALAHARQAHQLAPRAAPFSLLAAFYGAVAEAEASGRIPEVGPLPIAELPPEMAALAAALRRVGAGPAAEAEEEFAQMLLRFPRSARGYFLLGLWRLHAGHSPDQAAAAFRHAVDIDPGYLPAARHYVQLLLDRDPAGVEAFLSELKQRMADKAGAYRLRQYAEQLQAEGPSAADPHRKGGGRGEARTGEGPAQ